MTMLKLGGSRWLMVVMASNAGSFGLRGIRRNLLMRMAMVVFMAVLFLSMRVPMIMLVLVAMVMFAFF